VAEVRLLSAGAALRLGICAVLIAFGRANAWSLRGLDQVASIALLVLARSLVPKAGAATLTAIGAGILALFLGPISRGAIQWIAAVASGGIVVDAIVGRVGAPERPSTAVAAGAAGSLAPLAVTAAFDAAIGASPHFLRHFLSLAAILMVVVGAIGGLIGFLCARFLRGASGRTDRRQP
jgi:hypothetical protein